MIIILHLLPIQLIFWRFWLFTFKSCTDIIHLKIHIQISIVTDHWCLVEGLFSTIHHWMAMDAHQCQIDNQQKVVQLNFTIPGNAHTLALLISNKGRYSA